MSGNRGSALYAQRALELLADGKWHDGLAWMREVEKDIPFGVAQRRQERVRQAQSQSEERVRPLSVEAQISLGKRSILQSYVHGRVRYGTYEVDPWPLPPGGWKRGGWRIRLRPSEATFSLNELEARYGISVRRLRELVLQHPPLRRVEMKRSLRVYETELAELDRRVEVYKSEHPLRRRAGLRRDSDGNVDLSALTLKELAIRAGLAPRTVRRLQEENPQLKWRHVGRSTLLAAGKLPAWDEIVNQHKAGSAQRRSEAARRTRETGRMDPR